VHLYVNPGVTSAFPAKKAIAYVERTIEAVTQLLPQLDLWR
jgi:hypothetical protein